VGSRKIRRFEGQIGGAIRAYQFMLYDPQKTDQTIRGL
jgi:hypothetical protein